MLLLEGEADVQYNAAGAIFNIMTTNGRLKQNKNRKLTIWLAPFANKVRQMCFKNLLSMSTTSTNERVRMICTKGAMMVVIKSKKAKQMITVHGSQSDFVQIQIVIWYFKSTAK